MNNDPLDWGGERRGRRARGRCRVQRCARGAPPAGAMQGERSGWRRALQTVWWCHYWEDHRAIKSSFARSQNTRKNWGGPQLQLRAKQPASRQLAVEVPGRLCSISHAYSSVRIDTNSWTLLVSNSPQVAVAATCWCRHACHGIFRDSHGNCRATQALQLHCCCVQQHLLFSPQVNCSSWRRTRNRSRKKTDGRPTIINRWIGLGGGSSHWER
jgi:hypothetical protein